MRVFIVDDHHPLICVAVTAAAEAEGGEVVGVAGSGREALEAIPRVRPDVVVLDIRLPDMSGFAIAQQLQSLLPSVRILALSGYIDDFIQMETDRLRLAGFVHKASVSLTYLRTALATVHAGRTYFCPRRELSRQGAGRSQRDAQDPHPPRKSRCSPSSAVVSTMLKSPPNSARSAPRCSSIGAICSASSRSRTRISSCATRSTTGSARSDYFAAYRRSA